MTIIDNRLSIIAEELEIAKINVKVSKMKQTNAFRDTILGQLTIKEYYQISRQIERDVENYTNYVKEAEFEVNMLFMLKELNIDISNEK